MAPINWAPTTSQEVIQNLDTLLDTEPGTVPFARALGVPQDVVDSPESVTGALLQAAIFAQVAEYEPRCPPLTITLTGNDEGVLQVAVQVVTTP